ncbi:MAG: hypothetical protein H6603_11035 [Flavobacteriales bacterium]|nr:hypothetical protein [Flavobacteriales bacterium]
MQSSFEEKRQFLLKYPKVVLDHMSLRRSFTHEQLRKYRGILTWNLITGNEGIPWNTDMVDEFVDLLFPEDDLYGPDGFSLNRSLPWDSIEFVKRYEHLWDWYNMAANDMLKGECRAYYLDRLMQYDGFKPNPMTFDDLDLDPNDSFALRMRRIPTRDELEETHKDYHDFLIHHPELAIPEIDWNEFSGENRMYWTEELIATYEDLWNWERLSNNPTMPWTLSFMQRYQDRLVWKGEETVEEDGWVGVSLNGVGSNEGVAWSTELFDAFHEKLGEYHDILFSKTTTWTLPLLARFIEIWGAGNICLNPAIWQALFAEFDEEENLVGVLDGFL